MIHNLKPYPAYKDSGVPWLGEVPDNWDVIRNKLFLREINERSEDGSEELLTVSQYTGVTARRERLSEEGELLTNAASLVGYKRVTPGDIVMNIMLAWNGSLGVSPIAGIASPAYCVYRVTEGIEPRFLHYLFRTPLFTGMFKTVSTGVVESRLRLYPEVFFRLSSLLPPKEEQSAIIHYLDYIDRRIRRYIRAKQKLIKLLEEQKQAIIHQAVTRGLDPDVKLKPSGVEWLGDVPEHWEIIPNRHLFRETTRKYTGENEIQLSLSQRDGLIETDQMKERSLRTASYDNFKICIPDDLVLNRFKAHLGVFFASTLRGIVTFHYGVFRPLKEMKTKYFELLYHTLPYKAIYAGVSNGMTVGLQNLSNQNFYKIKSIVPPLPEQIDILYFVEKETHTFDQAIEVILREISLLREYRTRLIADVVTGKLDVREAAANLPEKAEETETFDDSLTEDELENDEMGDQAGELEEEVLA